MFSYKRFQKYGDAFRPDSETHYKNAIKKGSDVVGLLGSSKAPKGYYQSGTTTYESMRGGKKKYAIYSKLPDREQGRTRPKKDRPKNNTPKPTTPQTPTTPTTPYQDPIASTIQSLQKQLGTLSTGTAAAIKKGLKQQQASANKAARQQLAAANKVARADQSQFNKSQRQFAAANKAAQKQYEQQLAIFNRNLLAQEEESLAQQKQYEQNLLAQEEAFAQAMLAREQEAEQYRLNQEKLAADFAEQQRLEAENRMIGERTFMSNQMRAASADPRFKIGMQSPGGGTYGTSQFKRRKDLRPTIFQGIQASTIPTIGGINI